jgi:hypothetical protein
VEPLEARLLFSAQTTTAFGNGDLTIAVPVADHVTITETVVPGANDVNGPYQFAVTDSLGAIGGAGSGGFKNVKNITVNVTASGSIISVQGIDDNAQDQVTGIPGNLKISDSRANNTLSVEVHDGFTVGGAVSISNTGKGSTFVPETITEGDSAGQVETGVFLDPNRKGSYGSVSIQGTGSVGLDGVKVFGNVKVNLGSATSTFVTGAEWVYRQDPDSPPWSTFRQDNNTIGGSLSVTGGDDDEVYSSVIGGDVALHESTAATGQDYALLGGVSIGNTLSILTSAPTSGVFADFSNIGGAATIDEGAGKNVLGIDSTYFGGPTNFSQAANADGNFIFIDSEAALTTAVGVVANGLPDDSQYIAALTTAAVLPPETGSTFAGAVTATQGVAPHQLDISQDANPVTVFASSRSLFKADGGTILSEASAAHGVPIKIVGYGTLTVTGF